MEDNIIVEKAKAACNKGFPYFNLTGDDTPLYDITDSLDAALKMNRGFPGVFSEVSCEHGSFTFTGAFTDRNGEEVDVTVMVDKFNMSLHVPPHAVFDFFGIYKANAGETPVEPVVTYDDVVKREG